uniref:Uncharacterized protein n=1 Tax=Trypanosoma vivax (strain Y486) TaxID=1055687 RepID=G0TR27_TRYVY|nr:conserved hypothetical protein [Trypanosoma vivax Y486]
MVFHLFGRKGRVPQKEISEIRDTNGTKSCFAISSAFTVSGNRLPVAAYHKPTHDVSEAAWEYVSSWEDSAGTCSDRSNDTEDVHSRTVDIAHYTDSLCSAMDRIRRASVVQGSAPTPLKVAISNAGRQTATSRVFASEPGKGRKCGCVLDSIRLQTCCSREAHNAMALSQPLSVGRRKVTQPVDDSSVPCDNAAASDAFIPMPSRRQSAAPMERISPGHAWQLNRLSTTEWSHLLALLDTEAFFEI